MIEKEKILHFLVRYHKLQLTGEKEICLLICIAMNAIATYNKYKVSRLVGEEVPNVRLLHRGNHHLPPSLLVADFCLSFGATPNVAKAGLLGCMNSFAMGMGPFVWIVLSEM